MAEYKGELKSLLMKVKEECEEVDLKLSFQITKIMASSLPSLTGKQMGGKMEAVRYFILKFSSVTQSCPTLHDPMDCISEVTDIAPNNLDSSLCFIQASISHEALCI